MKIAYLLNSYPMTSTTFIRREIEALEELGVEIRRYAVRRWDQALVEPLDIEEQQRTHYLLSGNAGALDRRLLSRAAVESRPDFGHAASALWLRLCAERAGALAAPRRLSWSRRATCGARARADGIAHVHVHFATNAAAVAMLAHAIGRRELQLHGPRSGRVRRCRGDQHEAEGRARGLRRRYFTLLPRAAAAARATWAAGTRSSSRAAAST